MKFIIKQNIAWLEIPMLNTSRMQYWHSKCDSINPNHPNSIWNVSMRLNIWNNRTISYCHRHNSKIDPRWICTHRSDLSKVAMFVDSSTTFQK